MTVGIVAMAEKETRDSNVVVAADRMVTAMRESPIEYEHPSTKLTRIEHTTSDVQVLTVAAGSVSLADELVHKIESTLRQREDSPGVRGVADLAAKCYNDIIRETINYSFWCLSDWSSKIYGSNGNFRRTSSRVS